MRINVGTLFAVAVLCGATSQSLFGQSCVGNCGGNAGNCWCDDACVGYNDCCDDYAAVCGNGCHSDVLGGFGYCSSDCKCAAGEGDCDNDNHCNAGLICVDNVGANYGFGGTVDVCEPAGGGDCHGDSLGGYSYCSGDCTCGMGEGDCDNDNECDLGLMCLHDVGSSYGFSSDVDVCGIELPDPYFTIETANFAGTSDNSYFFLRIRPNISLAYLKITVTFNGQTLRNMLPADEIIPSSTSGAFVNLVVSIVIEGVSFVAPHVGAFESALSVFGGFFGDLDEAAQVGATELVFDGIQGAGPGTSIDSYIWTKGTSQLSAYWTAEYAHVPGQTIVTESGPLPLNVGDFSN